MTELLHDIDAPSDAELISRVRGGDVAAYGELFARHVDAARRLARQLVRGPDSDDLVSDAFAKVLGVLQGGGGPDVAFRAYLLTAVRRLHVDKIRAGSKLQTSEDMEVFDAGVPFQDTAVAAFESGAAAKAFASLPERWQLVLWHLEVEGQKPAEVAPLLGMSANSVSALAYRAREGLRQAFLTMHLNDTSDTSCRWVNEHLGAYVRKGLAKREAAKVQTHLDECRRCTAMYLELTEVNSNLRGIIAPLLLGAAAAGYLSSTGAAAGGGFGLVAFWGRARDAVTANAGAATAGAVAAGVAAVATAGIMLLPSSGPEDTVTGADDPIGTVTTPGEPGGDSSPGGGREDREDDGDDEVVTDEGTAASAEPALDATPESVPVSDAGAESTEDGGPGSETDGGTGGDAPGGDTDPNQPPAEEPPGEEPPGEEPPGEEPPGEEPPAPPGEEPPSGPVSVNVTVAGSATLGDNSVAFEISAGTDQLPPSVEIDLESDPEGITFGSSAACIPSSDATSVVCSTGSPTTDLLSASFLRALVSTEDVPTVVTAPLVIPVDQPKTQLRFTLSVPAGYTDPDPGDNVASATYNPTKADVSLSLPESIEATEALDYTIPVTVDGVPDDYVGPLTFHLSSVPPGEAVFLGGDRCEVRDGGSTLVCSEAPSTFTVRVKNNNDPTDLTITLAPLADLTDPDERNNMATTTLKAYRPLADASVKAVLQQQGNSGTGAITATVGVEPAVAPVTLHVEFDSGVVQVTLPDSCESTSTGAICDGVGEHAFLFVLEDRAGNDTREADVNFAVAVPETWRDDVSSNDGASVTLTRFGEGDPGGGSGAGSGTSRTTTDGLAPSAATSPVAITLEATAQTLTLLAREVNLVGTTEPEVAKPTNLTERIRTNKPNTRTRSSKPLRVEPDKVTPTDRRDDRGARAGRPGSRNKSSAGGTRSQKKASDTTGSGTGTTSDGQTAGVEAVVQAVKKVL